MSTAVKHHSPGFLAIVNDAKSRIHEIDIEEYKRLLADGKAGQLVDVREESEFKAAHAAGAMHMSKGIIERDIETQFPDKETAAGALLRRRFSFGSGDRQLAKDGLHPCAIAGWRVAGH